MKKFRLKKEAVPFFKEEHATKILDWDVWQKMQVDDNALEEVAEPYVRYGIERNGYNTLAGWSEKEGSRFEFTIVFPDVKWQEHDRFSDGRLVRGLMDRIQCDINHHFYDFVNGNQDK